MKLLKISFFTVVGLFSFLNSAYSISDEKLLSNTLKEQAKNEKKCRSLYPNAKRTGEGVTKKDYPDTIKYFECAIDYANISSVSNPRKREEQKKNSILNQKILDYRETISQINSKMGGGRSSSDSQEIIIEKQVFIKREENKKITQEIFVEKKATNVYEAKEKCKNKGFKESSFDSLENYLFDKCLEEEGFLNKQSASKSAVALKAERARVSKAKEEEKLKIQRQKDENARQKKLSKKVLPPAVSTVSPKVEEVKKVPEVAVTTQVISEEKTIIKTESKPSEANKNVVYTKKTVCKIDENGGKVCMYDPRYKLNNSGELNPINK